MNIINLGIIGTSEIAKRRFMPALKNHAGFSYHGVASRQAEKAKDFALQFGGRAYSSYDELIEDPSIDAVYIPLPPALHFPWAKKALKQGKHVLLEKPFTVDLEDTRELIDLSRDSQLAVHENYMFLYHKQYYEIKQLIASGKLGNIQLIRTAFGFPFRGSDDFRYNKELGGGALLDCGGYPIQLAVDLLGPDAYVHAAALQPYHQSDIDIGGTATLRNKEGLTAQIAFGMNHGYKCEAEIWGELGTIFSGRIFTAPNNYTVSLEITIGGEAQKIEIDSDDQFLNSIDVFYRAITDSATAEIRRMEILKQGTVLNAVKSLGGI